MVLMKKIVFLMVLLTSLFVATQALAAQWTKLNENGQSKLLLDKQSVIEKDQLKKAWLKIEYKSPQKNLQEPDKSFNLAKVLWYFDCPAQKSATAQVVQYLNDEMVFSAGIDAKKAEYIEPVPETDVDIAMRYVCEVGKAPKTDAISKTAENKKADAEKDAKKPAETATKEEVKPAEKVETKPDSKKENLAKEVSVDKKIDAKNADKVKSTIPTDVKKVVWSYQDKEGPEHWGKLHPEFSVCETGRNQSPINIDETLKASLKKIRGIQKFPAQDVENTGRGIMVRFKEGNMLVLDNAPYQMKNMQLHAPSEHTIHGKEFPLEAQFFHADSKGNATMVAVLFKEGKANPAFDKIIAQLAETTSAPIALKSRILASELMPDIRDYYRLSGSLTTPPCTEGIRWIIQKTPMSASKEQIEKIAKALKNPNSRAVQALNGRVVLE